MGSKGFRGLPSGHEVINTPGESDNHDNHRQNNHETYPYRGSSRGNRGRRSVRNDQSYNYTRQNNNYGPGNRRHETNRRPGGRREPGWSGRRGNIKLFNGTAALYKNAGSYGRKDNQFRNDNSISANQENHQLSSESLPAIPSEQNNISVTPPTGPVHTKIGTPEIISSKTVNIKTTATESTKDSTESRSDSDSGDSVLQCLERATSLLSSKNSVPEAQSPEESAVNIRKEALSKKVPSSSSSSDSDSSSSGEEIAEVQQLSEEDVICLGSIEKIENLVDDDDSPPTVEKCLLCDKSGHISFHCQMICKNCNEKYHSLKNCPKPANISVVFSSFMDFCLQQSYKYNPNLGFTVDEQESYIAPSASRPPYSTSTVLTDSTTSEQLKRKKSRSGTLRSSRKRTSTSESSDSDVASSHRRKRRRNKEISAQSFTGAASYPSAFNHSFGFNPHGMINPLLAFSHMMGYNPAIGFPRHIMKD